MRLATVAEVRLTAPARCRVKSGGLLTDWLPWISLRAGGGEGGRLWSPPVKDEQVLLIAPEGDLAQAIVLPGVFSDDMKQGSDKEGVFLLEFSEDSSLEYRPKEHLRLMFDSNQSTVTLSKGALEVKMGETVITLSESSIEMQAGGGTLTIDSGGAHGSPDVTTGSVSLLSHKHLGVMFGPMVSGPPE